MPSQDKKVFPWLAFLMHLTFLPLCQLSRCFCSSPNPALTDSPLLKGLFIFSTLVTWGSSVTSIYYNDLPEGEQHGQQMTETCLSKGKGNFPPFLGNLFLKQNLGKIFLKSTK